jgi:hypothetical protein
LIEIPAGLAAIADMMSGIDVDEACTPGAS